MTGRRPPASVAGRPPPRPGQVIRTITRSQVHVLAESGRSRVDIADQLRISERAVPRILRDAPPTPAEVRADPRGEAPKGGRPSMAGGALVERVRQPLVDGPGLRAPEAYRRAEAWGQAGERSARSGPVRRQPPAPTPDLGVRVEGLPGEVGLLDVGEVVVTFADGRRDRTHVVARRLQRSRPLPVERTSDQKAESVVRAIPALQGGRARQRGGPGRGPRRLRGGRPLPRAPLQRPPRRRRAARRTAPRDPPRPARPRDPRGPGQALGQRLRCAGGRRPHRPSRCVPRRTPPAAGRSAAASPRQPLAQNRSVA